VIAVPDAKAALDMLRHRGVKVGMITNQSGVGRRLISRRQARAVNQRVDELLGPFDVIVMCPHASERRCPCRKPKPGMIDTATRRTGIPASRCAVVGDIGSDIVAAQAAGARGVLVPTPLTRADEITAAADVVHTLGEAVALLLRTDRTATGRTASRNTPRPSPARHEGVLT
jgi:HAD superfamily hydrolase (TIGR01662 family)